MKKFTDKINESVENKIPTAKDFFDGDMMGLSEDNYDWVAKDTVIKQAIKFAKMHVEAALKAASYNAEIENCGNPYDPSDNSQCVSEKSILNAYPVENIK